AKERRRSAIPVLSQKTINIALKKAKMIYKPTLKNIAPTDSHSGSTTTYIDKNIASNKTRRRSMVDNSVIIERKRIVARSNFIRFIFLAPLYSIDADSASR